MDFELMRQRMWEELEHALDTLDGVAVTMSDLDEIIVDLVLKQAPLSSMLYVNEAMGKTHEFNILRTLPTAPAEGEAATTKVSKSNYERGKVELKIIRSMGAVTGFQRAAARNYIDTMGTEILNAARAMSYAIEGYILWGDADADRFQYSGANKAIQSNRIQHGGPVTLALLDAMVDSAEERGAVFDRKVLVMSPQMISRVALLDSARDGYFSIVEFRIGQ